MAILQRQCDSFSPNFIRCTHLRSPLKHIGRWRNDTQARHSALPRFAKTISSGLGCILRLGFPSHPTLTRALSRYETDQQNKLEMLTDDLGLLEVVQQRPVHQKVQPQTRTSFPSLPSSQSRDQPVRLLVPPNLPL